MGINSVNNELVKKCTKLLQKKYRSESAKFLLEGYKAIKEAHDFSIKLEYVFVDKSHLDEFKFIEEKLIETTPAVLKKLSSTDSAPVAVATAFQKQTDCAEFKDFKKVILLENIKDMGNLGTIIRSAVAFKADGIVLYGGNCADIYNPKCVRSAVGNLWKIPIVYIDNFEQLKKLFDGFNRIATLPLSKNLLHNFKAQTPELVMFGSEADGLSDELINYSTDTVKIEMNENVESLNLSVSASVVMYELFAQA
ncbi:MAG TPA: hypothetical protein DEO94_00935 [Cyanobacteria bacterium UBA11991]|nr:RNA methyltransferase [Cyanobacteriota bacterium]MDY6359443.1 RNA methyltransferase [Cyanobacteriota bacterium]MDY6363417.1 RNA methyltransferase [Cyanobacteriota bacterium]MDY6382516.1 RNA methyltransferase [Cyanobacteriota bacterium]HCB10728.1 hypothetical protein [Cyanobacteria bacterium UBA11991]